MTQLDTRGDIAALWDTKAERPPVCEHREHSTRHRPDMPAKWLASVACPACGDFADLLLCEPGRLRYYSRRGLFECDRCGHVAPGEDFLRSVLPLEF